MTAEIDPIADALRLLNELIAQVVREEWEPAQATLERLDAVFLRLAQEAPSERLRPLAEKREQVISELATRRDATQAALTALGRNQRASSAYQQVNDQAP